MTAVWESDVKPVARRMVLLAIADSANDEGVCWPHMATIASKSGVSLSTARQACADLEAEGLLEREYRKTTTPSGSETNKSSIYQINVEKLAARAQETPTGNRRPSTGNRRTPPPGTSGTPTGNRRHNRNENPQVEPSQNQGSAEGAAPDSEPGLFPAPSEAPEVLTIKASDVVAAYVDAYRPAHQGHDPLKTDIGKVAGAAARMLKDDAVRPHTLLAAASALGRTQFTDLGGQYRRQLQGNASQDPTKGVFRAEERNAGPDRAGETPDQANARVKNFQAWLADFNAGRATMADRPE